MAKSKQMEDFLEGLALATFGRSRRESIENGICIICGGPAKEFDDHTSRTEYVLSGMCQTCQNKAFKEFDE